MRGLLNSLADFPEFIDATSESNLGRSHNLVTPPPSFPFLIAQIAQSRPVLVVSGSSRGAEDIASELRDLHNRVLEFPAWETLGPEDHSVSDGCRSSSGSSGSVGLRS